VLIAPSLVPPGAVADERGLRLALLGALSARLDLAEEDWAAALGEAAPEARREQDEAAFRLGRRLGREAATEGVP
jgi:hypothetical protein